MARVSISVILEKVTLMESTLAVVARDVRALRDEAVELEGRMRSLEADRFPWKVIAGLAAVATLIASIVAIAVTGGAGGGFTLPPPPPVTTTK